VPKKPGKIADSRPFQLETRIETIPEFEDMEALKKFQTIPIRN